MLSFPFFIAHFERNRIHLDYSKFRPSHDFSPKRIFNDIKATSFQTFLPFTKNTFSCNFTEILKNITVPVKIIHGKSDLIIPLKVAFEIHNLIKGSELTQLDTNHVSVINVPEKIVKEIEEFI